jgi:hypothetical protein
VVALNPFAIVYLNAVDGSLIRSYSDYKTSYNTNPGIISLGGFDVGSDNRVHIASQTSNFWWQYFAIDLSRSLSSNSLGF